MLSKTVATSHMGLLSPCDVANVTEEVNWISIHFSRSVVSNSLRLHEPQHARPPCPSPTPGVHPNPCPLCRWCHLAISSSVVLFSFCPQCFPASGSFQMSQLFPSDGQSIGASASVLPMNIQDWFPLQWLVWSLCSQRDFQEYSPGLQFESNSSLMLSLLYGPTLTSVHGYWKSHSFDYADLCQQSDVLTF